MTENKAALFQKINRVFAAIQRVEKGGHNAHFNYSYVQASDLIAEVRGLFAEHGLIFLASTARVDRQGDMTTVEMIYTIGCTDTGESISQPFIGTGQDKGDKGLYKAYTGALKYFLMDTFLIPTGDDPEQESLPVQQARKPGAQRERNAEASGTAEMCRDCGSVMAIGPKTGKPYCRACWDKKRAAVPVPSGGR